MIREVLGQSVVYSVAIVLSRGMLMVALLIVAQFLEPADYGALIMITTIGALVSVSVPLEVSQGLVRYHASASAVDQTSYASTAFWFTVAMLSCFAIISELSAEYLCAAIFGDDRYLTSLRYAAIAIALNGIFYFIQCQFRWEFRASEFSALSVLHAFCSLGGAIGLGRMVDPAIDGVVLGQLLGGVVGVTVGSWKLRASLRRTFEIDKLLEMLRFSIPLVPASLCLLVVMHASRIILNSTSSLEAVGLFGFASQIAGLAAMATVGIQAALTPLVMARYREPETPEKLARLFEGFTAFAACICLGLGLFAQELILLFATPLYVAAAPLVLILAPAVIVNQMYIFAPGLAIAKKTIWQMWIAIASAGIGIVTSAVLIGLVGLYGASIAALLSAIAFLAMWFRASQRLYAIPIRWRPVTTGVVLAATVGILAQIVQEGKLGILIKATGLAITMVLFCAIKLVKCSELRRGWIASRAT